MAAMMPPPARVAVSLAVSALTCMDAPARILTCRHYIGRQSGRNGARSARLMTAGGQNDGASSPRQLIERELPPFASRARTERLPDSRNMHEHRKTRAAGF